MPEKLKEIPMWQWLLAGILASELLTLCISFFASHLFWGKMPDEVLIMGIIDSLVVSFIVVGILLFFIHTIRKLYAKLEARNKELSLAISEIKTLQGILPICCYCKQVRNDKGYYEQIESYIHKHSGVDFSHTVCPACLKKHHPDVEDT